MPPAVAAHSGLTAFEQKLCEWLTLPYTLITMSVETAAGTWSSRAEYAELPGCVAEARSMPEAVDRLEDMRLDLILRSLRSGADVPRETGEAVASGTTGLSRYTISEILERVRLHSSLGPS
jgi:hypothetical protein